jgi:hypothetical protein
MTKDQRYPLEEVKTTSYTVTAALEEWLIIENSCSSIP